MLSRLARCWVLAAAATALAPAGVAAARPSTDPLLEDQWYLRADGARRAWRQARATTLTVAVIDSGVDLTHPDLAPNLWRNDGEIPGNGIDDDGDGFVDDVHGYDFVAGDGDPTDEHGHGTHVAGVLAARGGNRRGVSGVVQRARIMALRVLDADNRGDVDAVTRAIDFAVAHGARVANLSLNTSERDADLERAIAAAGAAGMLIVASAGNGGDDLDVTPSFPACSPSPNVVAVGAIGETGSVEPYSNHGSCVDALAPGADVVATARGGRYESRTGTSQTAPQVAGAALLALTVAPQLTPVQLAGALREQPRLNVAALLRAVR